LGKSLGEAARRRKSDWEDNLGGWNHETWQRGTRSNRPVRARYCHGNAHFS